MSRNRICAWCVTLLLTLTFGISPVMTENAAALSFSLLEFGEGTDTSVELWVRGVGGNIFTDARQLVAPSGDVFDGESALESGIFGQRLRIFDTLEAAGSYMSGSWQATIVKRFFPEETGIFNFTINDLSPATINRTPPTLLTPSPGQVIKNGSTFLFSWDYLGTDDPPRGSLFTTIPQFETISSRSLRGVSTPTPGETSTITGSTGVGDRRFSHTLTNVPDADKNRFLYTMTAAEAALPLDVELTLGSSISLTDLIVSDDLADFGFFRLSRLDLRYSRMNEPFLITLSTVPEPTSASLLLLAWLPVFGRTKNGKMGRA
jgi:hypothetical protein